MAKLRIDSQKSPLGFSTKAVHAGSHPSEDYGEVTTPIFCTSTFAQDFPGHRDGFEYARTFNPTRQALEENIASLEHARFCLCFSSGSAATSAILQQLPKGSKILACADIYGGTYRLLTEVYSDKEFCIEFFEPNTIGSFESLIKDAPNCIWIETPTNPQLKVIDIDACNKLRDPSKTCFVVDNTFASPVLQNPLTMGADIVLHSTTKYIAGHSDILGGALLTQSDEWFKKLQYMQLRMGATPSPFDCYLALRSTKTLELRVLRQSDTALRVANFLETRKEVARTMYPFLPSHPQHELAKQQMRAGGGLVSFELVGGRPAVDIFISKLKLVTLAESLGAVESLIDHPASMTHASIPIEERHKMGISDGLLRLSVGVENVEDILADISSGLDSLSSI